MAWKERAEKCSAKIIVRERERKQYKYNLSRTEKIGSKLDPRAKLNRPHNGVRCYVVRSLSLNVEYRTRPLYLASMSLDANTCYVCKLPGAQHSKTSSTTSSRARNMWSIYEVRHTPAHGDSPILSLFYRLLIARVFINFFFLFSSLFVVCLVLCFFTLFARKISRKRFFLLLISNRINWTKFFGAVRAPFSNGAFVSTYGNVRINIK